MDPITQLFGAIGAVLFYGGLLALLVGLPVFLWLGIRFCRDVHRIADEVQHLSRRYDMLTRLDSGGSAEEYQHVKRVANSAFGR